MSLLWTPHKRPITEIVSLKIFFLLAGTLILITESIAIRNTRYSMHPFSPKELCPHCPRCRSRAGRWRLWFALPNLTEPECDGVDNTGRKLNERSRDSEGARGCGADPRGRRG